MIKLAVICHWFGPIILLKELDSTYLSQIYLVDMLQGYSKGQGTFGVQQLNNDFCRGNTPYFSINSIQCTII